MSEAVQQPRHWSDGIDVAMWPSLRTLLAVTSVLMAAVDIGSLVARALIVGFFVLVVPGWAVLEVWGLARGWLGAALTVATSTSLATVIALALLYPRAWSPFGALLVLALITLAADAVVLARWVRTSRGRAR